MSAVFKVISVVATTRMPNSDSGPRTAGSATRYLPSASFAVAMFIRLVG